MKHIEEQVRQLKARSQEPLCAYVYDLDALRAHVSRVMAALPRRTRFFYAVKANSEEPILRVLAPLVHGFEVASAGELEKVRAVAPEATVLFGGPGKTDGELERAVELGVKLLHVESVHELRRVEQVGRRRGVRVPVLLRVNLRAELPTATLQMAGAPTQFGIDEADIPSAIALALRCPHVDLQGFHFHSISNDLDASAHAELVCVYLERTRSWARRFGLRLSWVNAGGGIGINYADLESQFDWEGFTRRVDEVRQGEPEDAPALLFECGRFITAACGYYAVEVLDLKRNHGRDYAVVRGGTHHFRLPASWQHSHPFTVVPVEDWPHDFERPELRDGRLHVVGQLCTPKDVLAGDTPVSRVRIGDILLFRYAGAYGWAISHHDFLSHPHPAHVFLETGA